MAQPHAQGRAIRGRRFRGATAVALMTLVVLALTGCYGTGFRTETGDAPGKGGGVAGPDAPNAAVPQLGDCWDLDEATALYDGLWWVGWSVDCDSHHMTVTTAVLDTTKVDPSFEYPPDPYADEYSSTFYEQEALRSFQNACARMARAPIGLDAGTRVHSRWYLPSPEEWDAGRRWLRCDVGLLALGPFSWGSLDPVPGTAEELIAQADSDYRVCIDTPHAPTADGPWANMDGLELVACDGQSQWEFGTFVPFAEYPGLDVANERANDVCDAVLAKTPGRTSTIVNVPLATEWEMGYRQGVCWLL